MSAVIEISTLAQPATDVSNGHYLKLRRLKVKEYDLMIKNGIFNENDKIELLNGIIIEKIPKGTKHSSANDRAAGTFYRILGEKVIVRNQNPIWLDDFSEPEPDIVLAAIDKHDYEETHPTPNDIFLILEVSDSTLNYDRNAKCVSYSKAGILQYIVLNVQDQIIEDYREPGADGYGAKQTYRNGQYFNLVAFPEISFQVNDFFPKNT